MILCTIGKIASSIAAFTSAEKETNTFPPPRIIVVDSPPILTSIIRHYTISIAIVWGIVWVRVARQSGGSPMPDVLMQTATGFVVGEEIIGKIIVWRLPPSPSHRNPKKPNGNAITIAAERGALLFKISKREMLAINGAFVTNATMIHAARINDE